MPRNLLLLLFANFFLLGATSSGNQLREKRVQFEKGKSGAMLAEEIHGYDTMEYLLGAGAGQTMAINLETAHNATYFNVFAPGAKPGRDAALFTGETGGKRFEGKLPLPGDYRIQVFMMRSAARRNETATFTLEVSITGKPDPSVKAPEAGPWPLDTDASGGLPCSTDSEELDLLCSFRVKRNPNGATLWVIRPGDDRDPKSISVDDLRTLYMEQIDDQAKWSTQDAGEIAWKRDENNWIVTVGDGERYWIPDAAIWGG